MSMHVYIHIDYRYTYIDMCICTFMPVQMCVRFTHIDRQIAICKTNLCWCESAHTDACVGETCKL